MSREPVAVSDVFVSARGGRRDLVRFDGSAISAADGINVIPRFSCLIPSRAALEAGARIGRLDLLNRWVAWTHPTAGAWKGRITNERWRPGVVELTGEGWLSLLRRRRTPRTFAVETAPPGHLWQKIVGSVGTETPLPFRSLSVDGDGPSVQVEWRGDDAWELTQRLLSMSGHEVEVDEERNARWRKRLGTDKSATVCLAHGDGGAIADYRWDRDLYTVVNDVLAIGGDDDFDRAAGYVAEDGDSIARFDRQQETRVYAGVTSRAAVIPRALAYLEDVADLRSALEMDVTDANGAWGLFRQGDSVRVELPDASALLTARVMARSIEQDRGTMRLACVVEDERGRR